MSIALVIFMIAAQPVAEPLNPGQPLWDDDVLVWNMTENSTWAGPGLTYCAGIFGPQGKQYAGAIIDSTGSQGDVYNIYSTSDGGDTWDLVNWVTGGNWRLTDPELCIDPEVPSQYLYSFYTTSTPLTVRPEGIRYTLPDFEFDSFLRPDWPASDTLLSVEAVCDPASGCLWVFGDDSNHEIYMTRSTDCGDSWTTAELVSPDAVLPSAAEGPGGWVYLTYRRASDNSIMFQAFTETTSFETKIADGGDTSAPIVASEQSGSDDEIAVIFHDEDFDVIMAISGDNGSTWDLSSPISRGYYPFIDVHSGTRRCALSLIDFNTGDIHYASANNLQDLEAQRPEVVSDQPVSLAGPPGIRHGTLSSEVGLFYMSPGSGGQAPQDLWYDNSLRTESNPGAEGDFAELSAGPSPFSGSFNIQFHLESVEECRVDVYSMDGRLAESVYSGATSGEVLTAGAELPSGAYRIVLRAAGGISSRSVVKIEP